MATADALAAEARSVLDAVELDHVLAAIGTTTITGSAALGLMVWRDLDVTVVCDHLDDRRVLAAATELANHSCVSAMRYRDDTGRWNLEPQVYPDGLYVGLSYCAPDGEPWSLDIWFVDEPERQPDLAHLRDLPPRLTLETRLAILEIKTAWFARSEYGGSVRSFDIYSAVLDAGVRDLAGFNEWLQQRS